MWPRFVPIFIFNIYPSATSLKLPGDLIWQRSECERHEAGQDQQVSEGTLAVYNDEQPQSVSSHGDGFKVMADLYSAVTIN